MIYTSRRSREVKPADANAVAAASAIGRALDASGKSVDYKLLPTYNSQNFSSIRKDDGVASSRNSASGNVKHHNTVTRQHSLRQSPANSVVASRNLGRKGCPAGQRRYSEQYDSDCAFNDFGIQITEVVKQLPQRMEQQQEHNEGKDEPKRKSMYVPGKYGLVKVDAPDNSHINSLPTSKHLRPETRRRSSSLNGPLRSNLGSLTVSLRPPNKYGPVPTGRKSVSARGTSRYKAGALRTSQPTSPATLHSNTASTHSSPGRSSQASSIIVKSELATQTLREVLESDLEESHASTKSSVADVKTLTQDNQDAIQRKKDPQEVQEDANIEVPPTDGISEKSSQTAAFILVRPAADADDGDGEKELSSEVLTPRTPSISSQISPRHILGPSTGTPALHISNEYEENETTPNKTAIKDLPVEAQRSSAHKAAVNAVQYVTPGSPLRRSTSTVVTQVSENRAKNERSLTSPIKSALKNSRCKSESTGIPKANVIYSGSAANLAYLSLTTAENTRMNARLCPEDTKRKASVQRKPLKHRASVISTRSTVDSLNERVNTNLGAKTSVVSPKQRVRTVSSKPELGSASWYPRELTVRKASSERIRPVERNSTLMHSSLRSSIHTPSFPRASSTNAESSGQFHNPRSHLSGTPELSTRQALVPVSWEGYKSRFSDSESETESPPIFSSNDSSGGSTQLSSQKDHHQSTFPRSGFALFLKNKNSNRKDATSASIQSPKVTTITQSKSAKARPSVAPKRVEDRPAADDSLAPPITSLQKGKLTKNPSVIPPVASSYHSPPTISNDSRNSRLSREPVIGAKAHMSFQPERTVAKTSQPKKAGVVKKLKQMFGKKK